MWHISALRDLLRSICLKATFIFRSVCIKIALIFQVCAVGKLRYLVLGLIIYDVYIVYFAVLTPVGIKRSRIWSLLYLLFLVQNSSHLIAHHWGKVGNLQCCYRGAPCSPSWSSCSRLRQQLLQSFLLLLKGLPQELMEAFYFDIVWEWHVLCAFDARPSCWWTTGPPYGWTTSL